jgi:hypothetical protein
MILHIYLSEIANKRYSLQIINTQETRNEVFGVDSSLIPEDIHLKILFDSNYYKLLSLM